MHRKRLITPAIALVMAFGLIGLSGSVPIMGSENTASAAGPCYTLMTLDSLFGIQIDRAHNGLLHNGDGQVAGAVLSPTKVQRATLRNHGWFLTGEGRLRSAWAPSHCGALSRGGWTPSVTKSRKCMSVAQLDSRYGIVENAQGTRNGLIRDRGKIIGAVVTITTRQKQQLQRKDWEVRGVHATIKSIFAPSWCRPVPRGGWQPTPVVCYTFQELSNQFGIVAEADNGGRLFDSGQLAGAQLHLDGSERSKLTSEGWTIQDESPEDDNASAWSPERCRPLHES